MHRRAKTYATGVALAVTLSAGLTACTGSSDDGEGTDTKPGTSSSAAPPAEPGKFSTLPEPCGAVSKETLKKLLPAAEAAEDAGSASAGKGAGGGESDSPYEGEATVTYDTDRRVGCRWKSATSLATRNLTIDLERVVSYDPAVSDDEQAQLLYDERAGQAEIPTGDDSAPPEGGEGDKGSEGEDGDAESGKKDEKADGKPGGDESEKSDNGSEATGEPPADDETSKPEDEDLSPRMLDDIGDGAYIDDQLDTGDSGVHRDITLVFRSANVIATVKYDQWLTDKRRTPDSAELQEKARSVAEELAAGFDDN